VPPMSLSLLPRVVAPMPQALRQVCDLLLPGVASCTPGGPAYNPGHCMALYYPEPADELGHQLPAILLGESLARSGQACTLLEGIPAQPPGGCVILGTWAEISACQGDLLRGLSPPAESDGYILALGRHALLVGHNREGVIHGANTFIQILASCPDTALPGLCIQDQPLCRQRGLVYDLTAHEGRIDHLVHIVALLSSFKGNRLHLLLSDCVPLAEETQPGTLAYDDAVVLGQTGREYGVTPVPWVDLAARVARGEIRPGEACEIALDLANAFDTNAVGLGGAALARGSDLRPVRQFLQFVRERIQDSPQIYLPAEVARSLYADIDPPAGIVAVLDAQACAPDTARSLQDRGAAVALHPASPARGFVPQKPTDAYATLDQGLAAVRTQGLLEFGYHAGRLRRGHVCEDELTYWIPCVSCGWDGHPRAGEAALRFGQLAFGDLGELCLEMQATVAGAFPERLRDPASAPLRDLAFGLAEGEPVGTQLAALDWAAVEKRVRQAENAVRDCRNRLQRNTTLLESADLGLMALRFLGLQNSLLRQSREHYALAREGRAGSLALARTALENLLAYIPMLTAKLQGFHLEAGACGEEIAGLAGLQQRLESLCGRLLELQEADALPPAESLGFPL